MPIKLYKPVLKNYSDGSYKLAKINEKCGGPEDWFNNDLLSQFNLKSITFDFFIDWENNKVDYFIFIKRIIKNNTYQEVINDLDNTIINEFGLDYLNSLHQFGLDNKFEIKFLIINDDLNWKNKNSEILFVKFEDFKFKSVLLTIEELKQLIKECSGGPVSMGRKGLTYSTSKLEYFLSKTNSAYPGDVDSIILDENNVPICMLEFKKHNLLTPINEQKLSNYYPGSDSKKYDRLALLRDYLNKDLPLLIIYYPTDERNQGKLESIEGKPFKLYTGFNTLFQLPANKSIDEFSKVIELLKTKLLSNSMLTL